MQHFSLEEARQQKPIQYSENDIRDYLINYEDKKYLTQFAVNKLDYNGENGVNDEDIANWIAQHVTSFVNYESNRGSKLFEEYEFVSVLTTMYDEYYNRYDKVFQDRIDQGFYRYNPVSNRSEKEDEYVNALNNKDRWMTQASQTLQRLGIDSQTLQPINLNTSSQ
ncbi:hypothetical protein QTN25_009890 [Entamoeba marina]